MKHFFSISILCLIATLAFSQRSVSGRVTDQADGSVLPGVTINVKNTRTGTVTDANGAYSVALATDAETLIFTYSGYKTQEITINGQTSIDVVLGEDLNLMNEVVVVGYGEQRRGDLTAAISSIKGSDINKTPVASLEGAMQGRSAGVLVNNSSGQPGSAMRVNIRGASSINASNGPLYVIDGVPMVSENNSALFTGGYNFNSMADINPNDIESLVILKDASAGAIYGSRGANGVILITTKRGKEGRSNIDLEYYRGFQNPTNTPKMMDSKQFLSLMNEAAANDGLPSDYFTNPASSGFWADPNSPDLVNTDWYKEILTESAPITNYTLSTRGGNGRTNFFVSGGFFDQSGIVKGTSFQRFSVRSNIDVKVNNRLKIGTNAFVSRTGNTNRISDNSLYGVIINTLAADPLMPVLESDGEYADPFDYHSWYALENPRASTDLYDRSVTTNRLLGTVFGEYIIWKDLKFMSSWSADYQNWRDDLYYPSNTRQAKSGNVSGIGIYGYSDRLVWINENTLNWNHTYAKRHNLSLLGGYTMQETQVTSADINGENFANDRLRGLGLAADITAGSTGEAAQGLVSWIGRSSYNFDSKYYLTASVRADASSKFDKGQRYGIFPSISAAWRVSAEKFMDWSANWLEDLKIRGSYGLSGNQEGIGYFASRTLWSAGADYNGAAGTRPSGMGNGDLTWENTAQLDLGIDLTLLKGRVGLTFDYFDKQTRDLLLSAPVPATSGFSAVTRNVGQVENKGIELSLNTVNFNRGARGFRWETSFNIGTVKNKVKKLETDDNLQGNFGVSHILKEGYALGTYHLIHFEGVDPETGNAKYTDVNNDGIINADDSKLVSDKSFWPKFFGGLSNNFSYKGIELNVFLQFSKGNYLWNHGRHVQEQVGWSFDYFVPYGNNTVRVDEARWRKPGDVTDVPRAGLGRKYDANGNAIAGSDYQNWQEFSDQWLEDASYLRVKTLEFAYNLPKSWLSRSKAQNLRIFMLAQNAFTFTKYLGMDPETSSNGERVLTPGEDFGGIGQPKTFTFGGKLTF